MIKVLFMGRKPVASECLSWLLANDIIEVVGVLTDSHLAVSPTRAIAEENSIPIYEFSEVLPLIESGVLTFDLGVSVLYWRKLKDEFISVPTRGVINFHPAPLPEYKGTAGYNLAILDSLDTWSATAHYIDQDIDTGPIIKVQDFSICTETETAKSLEKKSQGVLYSLFVSVVEKAVASEKALPTTPNVGGRYVSRSEMEAMKEIKPGDDIPRKIRAFWFPPYDGAYIDIDGQKYTLTDRYILETLADPSSSNLYTKSSA